MCCCFVCYKCGCQLILCDIGELYATVVSVHGVLTFCHVCSFK